MKLRKRQLMLLVLATLALILGLGAVVYHLRAKRAVADYQKELVASGEKLTVDALLPKPVPPDQNGANTFFHALRLMNVPQDIFITNPPSGMTMVAPGKARVGWAQPSIRSREDTNDWKDAVAIVDNLSAALTLLEELIERPHRDSGINYQLGFAAPLPNLAQTKEAAQKLYYSAICDLHRGDAESATMRLRALLAISQGSADERLVISQLVRIAITAIGAVGTWELLQSPSMTDQQLALIQSDWSHLEFILAAENALAMERAMSELMLDRMRSSSGEFKNQVSSSARPFAGPAGGGGNWLGQVEQFGKDTWNSTRLKAKEAAWRFSWSYTDQLHTLKGNQVLIETARLVRTNGQFSAALQLQAQRLGAIGIQPSEDEHAIGPFAADLDFRNLFSQGVLSLTRFLDKVMTIEVSRQLVGTAVALQRYKLRHGSYPQELAALVPELLPALPRDPVDGEMLRYKLKTDGTFLLYSVGKDGEDNGGDPKPADAGSKSLQWQRGRDWVWPQPATPKEVEDFFSEKRK